MQFAWPSARPCYIPQMDAPRQYTEELRSDLGFYPTWMPSDPVELGTFGTFKRGVLHREGCLADLGINIETRTNHTKNSFKAQRGMQFDFGAHAHGDVDVAGVGANVEVTSRRAFAWAFAAGGVRLARIENIFQVSTFVQAAYRTGDWKREWLLVTEVQQADWLRVVIAKSKRVHGKISTKSRLTEPVDVLLSTDVSFQFDSDDVFLLDKARDASPLYGLRALQGFLRPGLSPIAGGTTERGAEELALEEAPNAPMFADDDRASSDPAP